MIFVEGFGEGLPYRDNVFDISLVAATLEHCVDPQRVIAEGYRCIKPEGSMIVIEGCRSSESSSERLPLWKRVRRHAPKDLLGILYYRVFHPDVGHLHQFTDADVKVLLELAGFSSITREPVPDLPNCYAFEAWKPS
jgi:ubiquinone/menaquinone biosynthesis C-methylase UbiE